MITVNVKDREIYFEDKNEFHEIKGGEFHLEHSLHSISKWETKYLKPFVTSDKSTEELLDYFSMMNLDETTYLDPLGLDQNQVQQIVSYIEKPKTAQTFKEDEDSKGKLSKEIITSELVYYWMSALQLPFECQYWNFDRLIALVRLASIKNAPEKKETKAEALKRTRATNLAMRAKYEKNKH